MTKKTFFHDFGKAAFGTLEVELAGTPGTAVEIVIGEVAVSGRVNRTPGGCCCVKSGIITLTSPVGVYQFEIPRHVAPKYAKFSIPSPQDKEVAPFRYVEITGDCIVYRVTRRELFPAWEENAAVFTSSDNKLNRVWEFCKYSIKATAGFGIFIDGERERCPYEGDTYINQLSWFCCSRDPEIPRRTLEFFRSDNTWPIEWSLLMPQILNDYILYSGDEAILPKFLPALQAKLLCELEREDGLIGENEFYKELIDWPKNERDGYESSGVSLIPNCVRYQALTTMAHLSGDTNYAIKAENLKRTIREKMFKEGRFTDSPESTHTAQHSMFFPVATGVASPEEIPALGELDIKCSVYAVQFLLDALYRGRFAARAMELLRGDGLRSWINMLNCGTTITMEAWDMTLKPNSDWNHAWGAAPANIIPRRLCGVRPTAPGFREFIFDPQPGALEYFRSLHPTPAGTITVEYDSGKFSLSMPDGCTALWQGKKYTKKIEGVL